MYLTEMNQFHHLPPKLEIKPAQRTICGDQYCKYNPLDLYIIFKVLLIPIWDLVLLEYTYVRRAYRTVVHILLALLLFAIFT
jgi:hypothetical protein